MKTSRGVVKELDQLGRIVIPKEMRRALQIKDKDLLEVSLENGRIVIEKFRDCCIFCSTLEQLVNLNGTYVCQACINLIKSI